MSLADEMRALTETAICMQEEDPHWLELLNQIRRVAKEGLSNLYVYYLHPDLVMRLKENGFQVENSYNIGSRNITW